MIRDPHFYTSPPQPSSLYYPFLMSRKKLKCGIILNAVCARVSVHSYPTRGIPREDGRVQQDCRIDRLMEGLNSMYQAFVVGLKALHDLLNKRLEQQVKNRTVKSIANFVLCVYMPVAHI